MKNLAEQKQEVQLGQMGRDLITGYEGLCISKNQFLTGCDQVLLVPTKLDKDGKRQDGEWFDVNRVEPQGEILFVYEKGAEALKDPSKRRIIPVRQKGGADERLPPIRR